MFLESVYGGTRGVQDTVVDILNYALSLECSEAGFYVTGLASSGLIPAGDTTTGIQFIPKHEPIAGESFGADKELNAANTAHGGLALWAFHNL